MEKDWRLEHLETQPELLGVDFVRKPYTAYRPGWDHDHCVACWAKLMAAGGAEADALHEGYATTAQYRNGPDYDWVCPTCFELFADVMRWGDVTPPSP